MYGPSTSYPPGKPANPTPTWSQISAPIPDEVPGGLPRASANGCPQGHSVRSMPFSRRTRGDGQAEWLEAPTSSGKLCLGHVLRVHPHANERLGGEACRQVGASSRSRRERPFGQRNPNQVARLLQARAEGTSSWGRADFVLTAIVGEATDPTDDPDRLVAGREPQESTNGQVVDRGCF